MRRNSQSVELTEAQRAKLEQHRKAWGLKTPSEAIRHLIEYKTDEPFDKSDIRQFVKGIRISATG